MIQRGLRDSKNNVLDMATCWRDERMVHRVLRMGTLWPASNASQEVRYSSDVNVMLMLK